MAGKISREELNDDLQQKLDDLEKPTYSEPIIINGGIGNFPANAANGQVSVTVKGNTETDEEGNTKSTVSAMRLKSVGKNLFDGELENGSLDPQGQPADMLDRLRSKNFIRVKNNEKITLSSSSGAALSCVGFYFYDINKRFISCVTTGATMTTTPSNCSFVKFRLATIDDVLSLNYGSQGFYEPYTESTQYITAKDEEGKVAELRSLPNGVKDEVRVTDKKLIKSIEQIILNGSWSMAESSTNTVRFYTSLNNAKTPTNDSTKMEVLAYNTEINLAPNSTAYLASNDVEGVGISSSGNLSIKINKSRLTTVSVTGFKEYLTNKPITLTYQLAEPEIIELPPQSLTAYSGGTIYVEPIVKETAVYGTGITIKDPSVPIKRLERVTKINLNDNSRMDIPISSCTVASDGLSFTSTILGSKDTIEYEYEYDQALSTTPTLEVVANMNLKAQVSSHDKTISSINQELSNFSDMTLMWIIELDSRLTALEGV